MTVPVEALINREAFLEFIETNASFCWHLFHNASFMSKEVWDAFFEKELLEQDIPNQNERHSLHSYIQGVLSTSKLNNVELLSVLERMVAIYDKRWPKAHNSNRLICHNVYNFCKDFNSRNLCTKEIGGFFLHHILRSNFTIKTKGDFFNQIIRAILDWEHSSNKVEDFTFQFAWSTFTKALSHDQLTEYIEKYMTNDLVPILFYNYEISLPFRKVLQSLQPQDEVTTLPRVVPNVIQTFVRMATFTESYTKRLLKESIGEKVTNDVMEHVLFLYL